MLIDTTTPVPTGRPEKPDFETLPCHTVDIIAAITARLKSMVPAVAVDVFPEKPDEYRLNHAIAALLVGYSGSQYAKTSDTGMISQQRELSFFITVIARKLNGTTGAIGLTDAVINALQGWIPPHCQRMWVAKDYFAGEVAGLWRQIIEVNTRTMQVQYETIPDWANLTLTKNESD